MTSTKPGLQEARPKLVQGTNEAKMSAAKYANTKGAVNLARLRQWKKKDRSNLAPQTPLLNLWAGLLFTSTIVTGPNKVYLYKTLDFKHTQRQQTQRH